MLFSNSGEALRIDTHLIPDEQLRFMLGQQIEASGGQVVDEKEHTVKPTFVLYDSTSCDLMDLEGMALRPTNVCLQWDWVLACHDQQKLLGPWDNDYGGFRFKIKNDYTLRPAHWSPTPSSDATRCSPVFENSPSLGESSSWSPRSSGASATPSLASVPTNEQPIEAVKDGGEARGLKRQRKESTLPTRRSISPTRFTKKAKKERREKEIDKEASSAPNASSSSATIATHPKKPHPVASPPTPPKTLSKNGWFGYEYTDEDREFLKKYLVYACTNEDDPDFRKMFQEMSRRAPHHKATEWSKYFYKHESTFAAEIPELGRLYQSSSADEDEGEGEGSSSNAKRSPKVTKRNRPAYLPKETFKPAGASTAAPSEEDRRALVKFLADAPEGVEQADLLLNFAHFNPSHSWRTWQKLVRENKASLDRAIAKRRQASTAAQS